MHSVFTISQLLVYPIKSLPGISLRQTKLSPTGFEWDRYWMLTTSDGQFITQREMPSLVFFRVELNDDGIFVSHKSAVKKIFVPFRREGLYDQIDVTIFDSKLSALKERREINDWFSNIIGQAVCLVFLPTYKSRSVKNHEDTYINFPDSSQYLFLGQAALHQLNHKLDKEISILRFRPNIVFKGGEAHAEDHWQSITIGDQQFEIVKSCGRCKIPTIDLVTGEAGKEPLKTLATYRRFDKNIFFGRYFKLTSGPGSFINVGDKIEVIA